MDGKPEVNLTYTLTYPEFKAGAKLGMRQNVPIYLIYLFARYLGAAGGLLLLVLALFSFFDGQRSAAWHLLPGCLLLLLLPLIYAWQWRTSFNNLREDKSSPANVCFRADALGFVRRLGNMGELSWRWSASKGVSANQRVILIAARKGAFIIIPRRVVSDAQLQLLREFQKGAVAVAD